MSDHAKPPPPPPPPAPRSGQTFSYPYGSYGGGSVYGTRLPSTLSVPGAAPKFAPPVDPSIALPASSNQISSADSLQKYEETLKKWRCKNCNLDLDSEAALNGHIKTHTKCTECGFQGTPKVVKGHYEARHGRFSGSGFKSVTIAIPGCRVQRFKICVGNRPEDVQKWIAERKKRYPRRTPLPTKTPATPAQGVSSLLDGYGSSSSEAEDDGPRKNAAEETGTADDMKGDSSQATPMAKTDSRSARPCRFFMRNGSCRFGDTCRFSHEVSQRLGANRLSAKRRLDDSRTSASLLRKLLANDMRRETALSLQLLSYIVNCNYMQEKQKRRKR